MTGKHGLRGSSAPDSLSSQKSSDLISGGGEMGSAVRSYPWATTVLGPMETWSRTLVATLNVALNSNIASAVYWGPEMIMIYNDQYRDNLGPRHPAAFAASARVVWEDLWSRYGAELEAVLAEGLAVKEEKVRLELEVDGHLQETFWNFSASPIYEGGAVVGIYKTDQNITEEIRAINALVESDERLRLALSANQCVGTWDWHVKTDRVFVEERFAELFGIGARDTTHGLPREDFLRNIHIDDKAKVTSAAREAVRTGESYEMEYRIYQPDGSVRWVSSRGVCIYDEAGEPMRFPGITFDITAEKQRAAEEATRVAPMQTSSSGRFAVDSLPEAGRTALTKQYLEAVGDSSSIVIALGPDPVEAAEINSLAETFQKMAQLAQGRSAIASLVEFIVSTLVEEKDKMSVRTSGDAEVTQVIVSVAAADLPRVVGNKGQTVQALRTLLAAASAKRKHKFTMVVEEAENDGAQGEKQRVH